MLQENKITTTKTHICAWNDEHISIMYQGVSWSISPTKIAKRLLVIAQQWHKQNQQPVTGICNKTHWLKNNDVENT
jgi:hypothetical protein